MIFYSVEGSMPLVSFNSNVTHDSISCRPDILMRSLIKNSYDFYKGQTFKWHVCPNWSLIGFLVYKLFIVLLYLCKVTVANFSKQ